MFLPSVALFAIPQTEQNVSFVGRLMIGSTILAAVVPAGLIFTASIRWRRRIAFAAGTWCLLLAQWVAYFFEAMSHMH
jgi:hypothetical protein